MFWACGFSLRKQNGCMRLRTQSTSEEIPDPLAVEDGEALEHSDLDSHRDSEREAEQCVDADCPPSSSTDKRRYPMPVRRGRGTRITKTIDPATVFFGRTLGKGAFSTVYKGTLEGLEVAIKVIKQDGGVSVAMDSLEMYMSQHVDHPNIVKVLGVFKGDRSAVNRAESLGSWGSEEDAQAGRPPSAMSSLMSSSSDVFSDVCGEIKQGETWVVMEFCDRGSLRDAIKMGAFFEDEKRQRPRVLLVLLTALEIALAIAHLHECGIIHGDLKPQNVMLVSSNIVAKDFICKVGDFGLSRYMNTATHISTFSCGTVSHMPPEVLRDGILTPATDIFSFGILLWELMSGQLPFLSQSFGEMMVSIVEGKRPKMPSFFPTAYSRLIRECWHPSREMRPKIEDVVERLRVMINGPAEGGGPRDDGLADSFLAERLKGNPAGTLWSESVASERIVAHPGGGGRDQSGLSSTTGDLYAACSTATTQDSLLAYLRGSGDSLEEIVGHQAYTTSLPQPLPRPRAPLSEASGPSRSAPSPEPPNPYLPSLEETQPNDAECLDSVEVTSSLDSTVESRAAIIDPLSVHKKSMEPPLRLREMEKLTLSRNGSLKCPSEAASSARRREGSGLKLKPKRSD